MGSELWEDHFTMTNEDSYRNGKHFISEKSGIKNDLIIKLIESIKQT